jgi:toxin YhaV
MRGSKVRLPSKRGRRDHAGDNPDGPSDPIHIAHGYALAFHPLLLDQLERLTAAAEKEHARGSLGANTKLLSRLLYIMFEEVPADPGHARYRQGKTLGAQRKHWFRVKFGNGRFRLFYRFSSGTQPPVILYVWVNDDESLRTYQSRSDAYSVFRRMLENGKPPDDWEQLMKAATEPNVIGRSRRIVPKKG